LQGILTRFHFFSNFAGKSFSTAILVLHQQSDRLIVHVTTEGLIDSRTPDYWTDLTIRCVGNILTGTAGRIVDVRSATGRMRMSLRPTQLLDVGKYSGVAFLIILRFDCDCTGTRSQAEITGATCATPIDSVSPMIKPECASRHLGTDSKPVLHTGLASFDPLISWRRPAIRISGLATVIGCFVIASAFCDTDAVRLVFDAGPLATVRTTLVEV